MLFEARRFSSQLREKQKAELQEDAQRKEYLLKMRGFEKERRSSEPTGEQLLFQRFLKLMQCDVDAPKIIYTKHEW